MPTPVFIVSTGRCGSTMLSNMVNLHPDLLSISEFFTSIASRAFLGRNLTGEAVFKRLNTLSPVGRELHRNQLWMDEFLYPRGPDARYLPHEVPPILCTTLPHITNDHEKIWDELAAVLRTRGRTTLAAHYRFVFDWLAHRFDRKTWIERSGASLQYIPSLHRMFPEARYVHIYRDGRDTALSMSKHHFFRLRVQAETTLSRLGFDPSASRHTLGTSRYAPFGEWLLGCFFSAKRHCRTQIGLEQFGKAWSRMIMQGLGHLESLPPDRVLAMRYESVLSSPRTELARFIRFIGPEFEDEGWLTAACALTRDFPPRWPRLDQEQQVRLSAACEPALTVLGYQGEATLHGQ